MAEDLGAELEGVARRDVALQFVFSSGDPARTCSSLARVGRFGGCCTTGASHTADRRPNHSFTPLWSQEALTAALENALDVR